MRYTTEIQVDDNGDFFFIIPDDLIQELGWDIGDTIEWVIEGNSVILSKKANNNDNSDSSN
jgi:antitoxin component of MazEF toxin-antitoxin module